MELEEEEEVSFSSTRWCKFLARLRKSYCRGKKGERLKSCNARYSWKAVCKDTAEEAVSFIQPLAAVKFLLPHLVNYLQTLLDDYRVQDMIKDVGVSAGQFLLNHLWDIIRSNGDVRAFVRMAGGSKMEMEVAKDEDEVEIWLQLGLQFAFMLLNNRKVQELAVDAGVGIFQFIADHITEALESNGDVRKFIARFGGLATEMELAEHEEHVEFIGGVAQIGLSFLFMLLNNSKVQELAVDAGVGVFQFIADHITEALESNGDVRKFVARFGGLETESALAEIEGELAHEFYDLEDFRRRI